MSWELVSFLILGAVLLAGFAWYERSRPPAQIVALVAALAALAIAGRIAFAAFPNVKPTTDIVIFAGFALGAAPGFAVGALAALVSNFWFGQGPWTPWQMAGWGLCGVLGALVALGFRNAGRLTLAATCGVAGIAYGALLNFSLMATYGGELSLERFGVLAARAIPFDAAHAIGNVVLALIAGPAIVRMLIRFRRRFEWERGGGQVGAEPPGRRRWRPALRGGGLAGLVALALLLGALAPSQSGAAGPESAVEWLRSAQNVDGGFGAGPDDDSGPEMTAWAMLGLAAADVNPYDVARGGRTPVSYLRGQVKELKSPGDLARTILALLAAGADPRAFGGRNLVADLHVFRRDNGSYLGWPNSTAFAVIALRAAGSPGGTKNSLSWLRKVQNQDGGWGIEAGLRSDGESTGAVLQALSAGSKAAKRGLEYLREAQQSNGGYRVGGYGAINTQATAWAVQGMLAADAKPESFRRGGKTPLDYLAANQAADGHYRYSKSSDQTPVWVTAQVLVAVTRQSLPIATPAREQRPEKAKPPNRGGGASLQGSTRTFNPPRTGASPGGAGAGAARSLEDALDEAGAGRGAGATVRRPEARDGAAAPAEATRAGAAAIGPGEEAEASAAPAAAGGERESDSSSGIAGAILIGLLAGCLLFGLGLLARKGWMRWRYGL